MGRLPSLLVLDSDLRRRERFPRSLWSKTASGPKPPWSEAARAPYGEGGQQAPTPPAAVWGEREGCKAHA